MAIKENKTSKFKIRLGNKRKRSNFTVGIFANPKTAAPKVSAVLRVVLGYALMMIVLHNPVFSLLPGCLISNLITRKKSHCGQLRNCQHYCRPKYTPAAAPRPTDMSRQAQPKSCFWVPFNLMFNF